MQVKFKRKKVPKELLKPMMIWLIFQTPINKVIRKLLKLDLIENVRLLT